MKDRQKNSSTSLEMKKNRKGLKAISKICTILGAITAVGLIIYFVLYFAVVVSPVKKVEKTYKEQTELIREIAERTPSPTVLKTNAELKNLTDDDVFRLVADLGDNSETLSQTGGSFKVFVESLLKDYGSDIEYEQFIGLADYTRAYCGTSDLNTLSLTGIMTDYLCDLAAVCFMYKAVPAIDALYDANYEAYNSIDIHPDLKTPLQLEEVIIKIVKDANIKATLLSKSNSINRIVQAEYSTLKKSYDESYGNSPNINAMFFSLEAQSVEDLIDLRMLACNEYLVTGVYLPMNLNEADSKLIDESRANAREVLIACNKRFNMTADGDNVTGIKKFFQDFAVASVDKVYDRLADYNILELHSYLHSPFQFTDEHVKRYNRDYVFWNMMLSQLTFTETTSYGTPVANLNYKLGTIDYGFIDGGNLIMEDSELNSLLWATAEQQVLAKVYSNCKIGFDENGNLVAEDTNDELVAAYRNWFEAWNLWGSQFTQ